MKFNGKFVHLFLGALAIGILGFLFTIIWINNPEREASLLGQAHQVTLINETLNQELWRYQLGVANNFDEIAQNTEKLKQSRTALIEGEYPVKQLDDSQIQAMVDDLELKLSTKEQQINTYFVDNTTLKKAIDFTRRQIHDLQKPPATITQLEQELYYAAYMNVAGTDSTLQNINRVLSQNLATYPTAQQFFIEQIVDQTNDIIEKNRAIFLLLNEASKNSKNFITQNFETTLRTYFQSQQQKTFYVQSILFIVSVFSILYATYLLVKLSRKESALQKALSNIENLQYAFDQHTIISFSDAAGNFTHVNEKFSLLSEYSEQELIGKNHWTMYAGENSDAIYQDMVEKTSQGAAWNGELQSKTNTGKIYWVNATIVPFVDSAKQLYQFIAICTDITPSKRLEEQNTESKNFIQKLTDTMTQGVYAMDKQGLCSFWNRPAEHLLGWSKREVFMRSINEIVFFHDDQGEIIDLSNALNSNQTLTLEAWVKCKNGVSVPVSLTLAPLQEQTKIIGIVVVFQDISNLKEQQRLLNEAMQAAETANHTKSAFLANMSHEIRTPMNGIIGMTDLALDTDLSEEQREFLNISKNSANALLTIINDILDFSKIEAGKLELDDFEFDLHQAVRETLKNLSVRACQKGLEMILDIDSNVPRYLMGDSGRLGQIIINLVGNAIKFTETGEIIVRIRFLIRQDGKNCLQFFIEDSGIGIPDDRQKDVFSSFSQVDATVFRKYGGTGLGLTIAKQLVELMNGKIGLTSQVGKGTSFHFTVWLKDAVNIQEAITPIDVLQNMSVFVVDNNDKMRNLIRHTLTSWGMDVFVFSTGGEILATLEDGRLQKNKAPQLLLIDEELEDTDGFSLVERLQQRKLIQVPVILMLSSVYSAAKVRNSSAKLACVISKPASQSDLLDAVHTVFSGPVTRSFATTDRAVHTKLIKPLNVLLAEDNAINQQLAVRLLEKQGHAVTIANNGQECLDKLAEYTYDLVLMDFQMPVMDGLEATRQLRAKGISIPVIAMTANAMKGDRERAIESGMTDYLTKPIRVQELFDVIGRYFPEIEPTSQIQEHSVPLTVNDEPLDISVADNAVGGSSAIEPMDDKLICDWNAALELLGGDEEILNNMAEMYVGNYLAYCEDIESALATKEVEKLTRALHSLKGVFALFQAHDAEQLLLKAENNSQQNQIAEVEQVIPEIKHYVVTLATFLRDNLYAK